MCRSDTNTVDNLMSWLTWSRLGSVQVEESLIGSAGVVAAERRRLCRPRARSSTCRRPPTAGLVLQSTSTSARKHLRRRIGTLRQHESIKTSRQVQLCLQEHV